MANQNVVVVSATDPPDIHSKYASVSSYVLGVKQIVIGIVLITLMIVVKSKYVTDNTATSALPLFVYFAGCSTFLIAGVCGIAAGSAKTTCSIIGFMVMSVISSVLAAIFFFVSIYANIIIAPYHSYNDNKENSSVEVLVYSFVALFFVQSVVSIWSAAICCNAVCCGRQKRCSVISQDYLLLQSHPSVGTTIQGPLQAGASTDVSQISFGAPPVY